MSYVYIVRYAVILEYEIMRDFYFRRLRSRLDILVLRCEGRRLPLWNEERERVEEEEE